MRINKFVASATGVSRRQADALVDSGRITVDGQTAKSGQSVELGQVIKFDDQTIDIDQKQTTILLNKPMGYVCSRNGQGSKTVYDFLPSNLTNLKPVGRLDKDSSGLILMTTDGQLAHELTHPKFAKQKIYIVKLDKDLSARDQQKISQQGVELEDGLSKLGLSRHGSQEWQVKMSEGRNRQIRRTFAKLGYNVTNLHRIQFGHYTIDDIKPGEFRFTDIS